jgi:hypothetical protein
MSEGTDPKECACIHASHPPVGVHELCHCYSCRGVLSLYLLGCGFDSVSWGHFMHESRYIVSSLVSYFIKERKGELLCCLAS